MFFKNGMFFKIANFVQNFNFFFKISIFFRIAKFFWYFYIFLIFFSCKRIRSKNLFYFLNIEVLFWPPASAKIIFVSVCLPASLFASLPVRKSFRHNLLVMGYLTCWSRWCHQNCVRTSRSAATSTFWPKIAMLPNAMKIESWVPQAMDNPMQPTFGRVDALRGSSVKITTIIDSTKHHEIN